MPGMSFDVYDNKTCEVVRSAELTEISEEPWASCLFACQLDGFAICEDGSLILTDLCGGYATPPSGRFTPIVSCDVTYCKDCRLYVVATHKGEVCSRFCSRTGLYTVPYAYCYWAERKELSKEER